MTGSLRIDSSARNCLSPRLGSPTYVVASTGATGYVKFDGKQRTGLGSFQGRNFGARRFKSLRLQNKEDYLKGILRSSVIRTEMCRGEGANVVPYSYFCHGLRNSVRVPDIPAAPVFTFYCSPFWCKIFGLHVLMSSISSSKTASVV